MALPLLPVMCFMLYFSVCSMGYCQDLVMGGCQPERLTLILIHSETSRKRKGSILVKDRAFTGGQWPFVTGLLLTPLLLAIEVSGSL